MDPQLAIVHLTQLSSTIICKLNTYTTHTIDFFCYFYLPLLLALPIYYASQGSAVLQHTENYYSAYQQWLSGTVVTVPTTELQTFQSNQVTASVLSPLPGPLSPCGSLVKVDQAWNSYLDSRLAEWKVIFTLACVFVAISVTAFQIPQVIDDPLTRFFACLAVYRTFTGLIYTPIFSLYFNSKFARSVHFAFLLSKENVELYSPWTVLSLPAATTSWGILFFLFTIVSYFWRSTDQNPPDISQTDLGLLLRGIIIALILLDIVSLFGIWKLLRKFRGACLDNMRLVGGHNHPSCDSSATPV